MSEQEKNIMIKLSKSVPKLDKDKQSYILGVADGLAIAKGEIGHSENEEELQET